jgi:hypothetical protein
MSRRSGLWLGAALSGLLFVLDAAAQQAPEATVKAAFLFKFAGYVEWPARLVPAADTPLVIGVLGSDEVAAELERIVPERNVNGHPVTVRRLRAGELVPPGLHVLFVGRSEPNARAAIRTAQQQGALTVTETDRGLETGGAINFVTAEDRVGFEVSLDSAERSGVRISARMLAVARRVVPRS